MGVHVLSDQEIFAALGFAGAAAIMSTIALATVAGNDDLARNAYEKSKLFSEEVPSAGN